MHLKGGGHNAQNISQIKEEWECGVCRKISQIQQGIHWILSGTFGYYWVLFGAIGSQLVFKN